jgi:hypothetical protein
VNKSLRHHHTAAVQRARVTAVYENKSMNVTDILPLLGTPVGSAGVCPWDAAFREENCREAFLNCGIYPLNLVLVISRLFERRPIELRPLGGGPQPSTSVLAEVTNLLALGLHEGNRNQFMFFGPLLTDFWCTPLHIGSYDVRQRSLPNSCKTNDL